MTDCVWMRDSCDEAPTAVTYVMCVGQEQYGSMTGPYICDVCGPKAVRKYDQSVFVNDHPQRLQFAFYMLNYQSIVLVIEEGVVGTAGSEDPSCVSFGSHAEKLAVNSPGFLRGLLSSERRRADASLNNKRQ
uniref:Rep_fac-A_C domain-containing protein n=1 Tax=Steinernema glaseri TaxID=37863 RepID=A0A1I7ZSU3_9BILA